LPGIEFLEEKMAETNKIRSVNNFHVFSLSSSGDGLVKLRHRLVQERRTTWRRLGQKVQCLQH